MDYRAKHGMYDDSWGYQNKEELLIFGYSCKLFRDDEKALSLEKEEHLIPWMGDSRLMIDRFDVRGALYDLTEAESKGNSEPLSEAELKEEEICEQERYLALYHDETQQQVASEEETKRLQVELASELYYSQVGFNYSNLYTEAVQTEEPDNTKQVMPEPITYNPTADEDVFIPPPDLNIPPEIEVPQTMKQNKIIIKTAKFIVSQGAQMEIVIKTKQAGNPMFNFLAFDHPLNAYYKYVVTLIRHGKYRWEDDTDAQAADGNSQYLHPNLSQSVRPDLTPGAVASPSRPSPHCSYTKLITNIREKQKATVVDDAEIASPVAPSSPAVNSNSVSQDKKTSLTPRSATEPVVGLVDYPSFNQTADGSDIEDMEPVFAKKSPKGSVHDYSKIKWPPREIQMVIDKMACYIIKNGTAFEEVVRSRSDSRFEFLNKSHEYHPYYKCKIELYNEVYGDIFKSPNKVQELKKKQANNTAKKSVDHSAKNGGSRTISFSIKSREQEVPLTSHTTFPIESSTSEEDEEMSEGEKERRKQEREQRRLARKLKEEKEKREREEFLKKERLKKEKEEEEKRKEKEKLAAEDDSSGNEDLYDIFKYAQEMQRDTKAKPKVTVQNESEEPVLKQEERKKKVAAFISKLAKDNKEEKTPPVFGPQMPPDIAATLLPSASQSPTSSRESLEREKTPPPPPPTPSQSETSKPSLPPPPSKSPSPPGLTDMLLKDFKLDKKRSSSREISVSPKRTKIVDTNSIASVLLSGLNEHLSKQYDNGTSLKNEERSSHKSRSRSHKKRSRQKSGSWSPSSKRERKKRKRSRGGSHRRKKHRSRSRSRSRGHSKSQRSYHKKKQSKHSSHREKEKSRKKKHKRHKSPSSVSSLPSSASSSHSSPTTLPSESESDTEVQVIESDERKSSRSSSIVSLPSVASFSRNSDSKKISNSETPVEDSKSPPKGEGCASGGEDNSLSSLSLTQSLLQKSRPLFQPMENSSSSDGVAEGEKKSLFNPNTSSAMAKITQGLRAKLNALLEKESKLE